MEPPQDQGNLLSLLKEKAKEIKQIKKKLKKCEDKYVEQFKTNKLLMIDRENLIKLLVDCFNDPLVKDRLNIDEFGWYDYEYMIQFVKESKQRDFEIYKNSLKSEWLPEMQNEIDMYKSEFENLNLLIDTYKSEIQEYRKMIQQHDTKEAEMKNENELFKARIKSLESILKEQSDYISDIKEVQESKTNQKTDELINKFKDILDITDEDDEAKPLKAKLSYIQDENLKLKETIISLRKEMTLTRIGEISSPIVIAEVTQTADGEIKVEDSHVQETIPVQPQEQEDSEDYESDEDEEVVSLKQLLKESEDRWSYFENQLVESRKKAQEIMIK